MEVGLQASAGALGMGGVRRQGRGLAARAGPSGRPRVWRLTANQPMSAGIVAFPRPTRRDARGLAEGQRDSLPAGRGRKSYPAEAGLEYPGSAGGS